MSEEDFRAAEDILIRACITCLAEQNYFWRIPARAKQYLINQFDRQPEPYVLRSELATAGKSTRSFDPEAHYFE